LKLYQAGPGERIGMNNSASQGAKKRRAIANGKKEPKGPIGNSHLQAQSPPTFRFFHYIFPILARGTTNHETNQPGCTAEAAAPSNRSFTLSTADHGHGRLFPATLGVPRRRLPQDLRLPQGLLHRYMHLTFPPPRRRHLAPPVSCSAPHLLGSRVHGIGMA
jgi:hypothetical protein